MEILSSLKSLNKLNLLLIFTPFLGFNQSIEEIQNLKKTHPESAVLYSKHLEKVYIKMIDGEPEIKVNHHDEFIILKESGVNSLANDEIYFSSFEKIEEINAYSLVPNEKGKFKKIEASNFQTKDAQQDDYVFHDDEKVTSFMYNGLKENAIRVLDYTELKTENKFPFGYSFNSSIPILNSTFIIELDTNIHIDYREFNFKNYNIKFNEELIKGKKILTWTIDNPSITKYDDRGPSPKYYNPHILGQIAYYNSNGKKINLLTNAKDLHTWYNTHIDKVVNEVPSNEMKSITDSIVKGTNKEIEKVKAIYYWVQSNIKYIAFEDGMSGFVPRSPNSILQKRYGDCKDMASLLYAMLKHVNITSHLTWIGTRDLPYKYTDFPSSICDNHMITTYYNNGTPYFLDATNSFLPLGFSAHGIIGKEAFVNISDKEYKIEQVPILPKENAKYVDFSKIKIVDNKIIGSNETSMDGYYNVIVNERYKNTPKDKLNDLVQSMNERGNNTFKVTKSNVSNIGERDLALMLNYDFELKNYVTSFEDEIYVNIILDKNITYGEIKADRVSPLYMDSYSNNTYKVEFELPNGYQLKYIPNNATFKSDFIDYQLNYEKIGANKILATVVLDIKFILLESDKFNEWNEFAKIVKNSMKESLVLQKIK